MDNDILTHASALVGIVTPFVVGFLKGHVIKVSDLAAHFLSLVVAAGAVTVAMLSLHNPVTWGSFWANLGIAFTLSQTIYASFKGTS